MRLVIVESRYAGDIERNVEYARACLRDCLLRGEAPIASHLLYTQPGVLRDEVPAERQHGIDAGLAWGRVAHATVVYTDLGISRGMRYGIAAAEQASRPIEYRKLSPQEMIERVEREDGRCPSGPRPRSFGPEPQERLGHAASVAIAGEH